MNRASDASFGGLLPVRGFALRLALTTSAIIVITCAILSAFLVQRNLAEVTQRTQERMRTLAERLANAAELGMLSGDRDGLTALAQSVRTAPDLAYVYFFDQDGHDLARFGETPAAPPRDWVAADATRRVREVDALTWELAEPIFTTSLRGRREELGFASDNPAGDSERKRIGTVVVGVSRQSLQALQAQMYGTAAIATALVALLGVTLATVLASSLTRPLQSLAEATEAITEGHLDSTVDVEGNDEIGALASSFNTMVRSLARSRAELEEYSHHLEEKVRTRTERLEALNEELREANRLKSEFLATVSHELRTPLHVIIGYASMLEDGGAGPTTADQRQILSTVRRYSKQQLDLLTDVLDFSRLTSGRTSVRAERFQLGDLLSEIVQLYEGRTQQGEVELQIEVARHLPQLVTDRIKLQEIVRNLVDNAVKFTHHGRVVLRAFPSVSGHIVIEVEDTGIGIAPEELERIFEPFHQTGESSTRSTGGVGLGLSIVKQLCLVLGGDIGVTSEVGRGSCFRVELPAPLPAVAIA